MCAYYSKIVGTGSYEPQVVVPNQDFTDYQFYKANGEKNVKEPAKIVSKLAEISGITERLYAQEHINTSDLAYLAAKNALESSGIDGESLDHIIVAHNFGDVNSKTHYTDMLPNVAAKVKQKLGIINSDCVAYDILFGCPSWVQGVIQADYYLRSGDAKRVMVIGSDVMSRVLDPHDLDSMLFGDGAGAVILERFESEKPAGILCHKTVTDSVQGADFLRMGASYNEEVDEDRLFVKMNGRSVYKYAMEKVPATMDACLKKANVDIADLKQILIHQANEKMIRQLCKKLYSMHDRQMPETVFPLTVGKWGNSSAATVPMLLDHILKGKLEGHQIEAGDHIILSSVGGGMHANCIVYKHV